MCRALELGRAICDELREDHKIFQIPSFFGIPLGRVRDWVSQRLPTHMMSRDLILTTSSIAEANVDKVVRPGAKGFADLQLKPHSTLSGVAVDHVRHWRKGGYNQGTNEPDRV